MKTLKEKIQKNKETWAHRANNIHMGDIVEVAELVSKEAGGYLYAYYFVGYIIQPCDKWMKKVACLWPLAKKEILSEGSVFKSVLPRIADNHHVGFFTDFEKDLRNGGNTKIIKAPMEDDNHILVTDSDFTNLTGIETVTAKKWHGSAGREKVTGFE